MKNVSFSLERKQKWLYIGVKGERIFIMGQHLPFLGYFRSKSRLFVLTSYVSTSNALLPSKGLDISNQMMFVRGHTDNIAHVNYPYSELLLWSVLCNMRKMALFMWECGDEHLARALVAGKMFNGMAKVTERDDAYADITDALNAHVE